MVSQTFTFRPVGIIHSCFKEKFGIPRQARLVPDAAARVEILKPFDRDEAFKGLEQFSHIWVVFVFHVGTRDEWKPTVRPPRLGGNKRVGVFGTRSGFRPNPIGISAVELVGILREHGTLYLDIRGIDMLDKTPVLDIKPYLPYADSVDGAIGGFAPERPVVALKVDFTPQALATCKAIEKKIKGFKQLIIQILQNDPRPAYYDISREKKDFGFRIHDVDVKWRVENSRAVVIAIDPYPTADISSV